MASPRVLIVLMPALAIVGAMGVWWMRGPAGEEGAGGGAVEGVETPALEDLPELAGHARPGDGGRLVPGAMRRISGRVLRPDGSPAVGALVSLRERMPDGTPVLRWAPRGVMTRSTLTDARGEFAFEVPSESDYELFAEPTARAPRETDPAVLPTAVPLEVGSETTAPILAARGGRLPPMTLRLRVPGRIEVQVTDERRRPVSGAHVDMASGPSLDGDGTGRYVRNDVVPGRWDLTVSSPLSDNVHRTVEVTEGVTTAIQVELHCGVRVSGTVVDPKGQPVPEARVRVVAPRGADGEDKVLATGHCDASGHFEMGQLPEGPLRLHADADGFDSLEEFTDVAGDTANVRVRGVWLGRVRMRLATSDGKPLPTSVEVNVGIPGEPHPFEGTADVLDGWIVVSEFSGDDEQLVVDVPGYAPVVRTLRVAPGKEVDLGTVTLDAGHDVDGVVVTPEGVPIPNAAVHAAGDRATDRTARDGGFHLTRLPAGPVDLVVAAEGYLTLADVEILVGAPRKEPLRLVLHRASVVRAKVERPDGKPAAGERLVVMPVLDDAEHRLDPDQRAFRTEEDGTFVVSLPPGPYRIEAQEGDRWVLLGEITLAEGEHRDLSLRLPAR